MHEKHVFYPLFKMAAAQNRENFWMAVTLKSLHLGMWDLHLNICFKGQGIHLTYLWTRIIDQDWFNQRWPPFCLCKVVIYYRIWYICNHVALELVIFNFYKTPSVLFWFRIMNYIKLPFLWWWRHRWRHSLTLNNALYIHVHPRSAREACEKPITVQGIHISSFFKWCNYLGNISRSRTFHCGASNTKFTMATRRHWHKQGCNYGQS